MSPHTADANPHWHALVDGRMPLWPANAVQQVFAAFGIADAREIEPWPIGPFDLPARFVDEDRRWLIKARFPERGPAVLHQTHRIQTELHRLGLPVAPLRCTSDGQTLVEAPGYADHATLWYEVQSELPGKRVGASVNTARAAGRLLRRFHEASPLLATELRSKFNDRNRWFIRPIRDLLVQHPLNQERREPLEQAVAVLEAPAPTHLAGTTLTHGDFTPANLLVDAGDSISVVDLDECGLGEPAIDLGLALWTFAFRNRPVHIGTDEHASAIANAFLTGYGASTAVVGPTEPSRLWAYLVGWAARDGVVCDRPPDGLFRGSRAAGESR